MAVDGRHRWSTSTHQAALVAVHHVDSVQAARRRWRRQANDRLAVAAYSSMNSARRFF
jgi:hypothetical protein